VSFELRIANRWWLRLVHDQTGEWEKGRIQSSLPLSLSPVRLGTM